jgi:hypothetical protein
MGLLDDAIREHLELKRRHGASDEEIAHEEAEALGPARREFPAPEPQAAEERPSETIAAEPALPADEPFAPTVVHEPAAEREHEPVYELEPEADYEPQVEYEPEPEDAEDAAPDPHTRPHIPEPDSEPRHQEPEPSHLEPEPESDDVLEETPEFLQDAPEHDRLWFEQKPPRDFDFE